jgi:hypothetical protein
MAPTHKKNFVGDLPPLPAGLVCGSRGLEQHTMVRKVHERGRPLFG